LMSSVQHVPFKSDELFNPNEVNQLEIFEI